MITLSSFLCISVVFDITVVVMVLLFYIYVVVVVMVTALVSVDVVVVVNNVLWWISLGNRRKFLEINYHKISSKSLLGRYFFPLILLK